jgi:hypothetical protein
MFTHSKIAAAFAVLLALTTAARAASDWQVVKVGNRDYLTVDNISKFYGLPASPATSDSASGSVTAKTPSSSSSTAAR